MADVPFVISGFFLEYLLPFALIFTLIFAILQKSKLLGEGKKQIDAIIGLVVGLILIAYAPARLIVVQLQVFLAVFAAILLVFMLLMAFISQKKEGDILGKWFKYALYTILVVALIITLIVITGYWDFVTGYLSDSSTGGQIWVNGLIIVVIVGALIAVLWDKGEKS